MMWLVTYQWGTVPGAYNQTFLDYVDAVDLHAALAESSASRPINSRVVAVAMCDCADGGKCVTGERPALRRVRDRGADGSRPAPVNGAVVVRHVVKPRSVVRPADFRTKQVAIRMTSRTSARLASIQGLIAAYGEGETLARLFELVMLPALAAYVTPYAERAIADREEVRHV